MANTSQIRQLQTPDNSIDVYPLTLEDAVFDENGVQLSTKISNMLTGVKGNAESTYRHGNVNLTLANLGYESVNDLNRTTSGGLLDARQGRAINTSILSISGRVDGIEEDIATVESSATSAHAYAQNDFLIYQGQLYKVTAAIAIGDTLTVGTNITPTKVTDNFGSGGGGGGGHTILDSSGTTMTQETKMQFSGMNVTDDSTNGKTVVHGQLVKVTKEQYDALSSAEQNDPNITYELYNVPTEYAVLQSASITIATTGWSNSTTTVDSVAYYTHETSLSSVFDAHPDVYLGALSTFPSNAEKQAYMCVDYITVDAGTNKLKCYARSKPSANFVLIVKGVSV